MNENIKLDPLLDFSGKAVLITGAAQGFGKLLAEELAQRGAKLVLGDIKIKAVQAVADEINAGGGEATAVACDVSKNVECQSMVDSAVDNYGQLDIAVNNAGIAGDMKHVIEFTEADMDRQFAVNTKGVFFGMQHQVRQMRKSGGGAILNVSSMAGIGAAPKGATYAAAKHAVIGLTKTAAFEYAADNVRVNAICPYFTLTEMLTSAAESSGIEDVDAFLGRGTPMRRVGRPEEIVNVMLMMISPGNTFMSGQAIAVDGGSSAI
jgi:NAD(P)-dependent dehydrogenase (short-subunit alcohol dehydrogenase family)